MERKVSLQDRLGAIVSDSVDLQYPPTCTFAGAFQSLGRSFSRSPTLCLRLMQQLLRRSATQVMPQIPPEAENPARSADASRCKRRR